MQVAMQVAYPSWVTNCDKYRKG